MNNDVINLGLVLRNFENFNMTNFDGRLTLQKSIYLMQAFGIYLGYNFSWYLRGPYSPRLARDGFALQEIYRSVPIGSFEKKNIQSKFEKFLNFMKDKKKDSARLEIIASIHFLKKIHKNMSKSEILEKVKKKQVYFTKKQCEKVWNELKEIELI